MTRLEGVRVDRLRAAPGEADSPRAVMRPMIVIACVEGVPASTLSARYGITRSTILARLDRFEARPVGEAAPDGPRPGQPPALTDRARDAVRRTLAGRSPAAFGFPAHAWTPVLARRLLAEEHGVPDTTDHVRRLIPALVRRTGAGTPAAQSLGGGPTPGITITYILNWHGPSRWSFGHRFARRRPARRPRNATAGNQ